MYGLLTHGAKELLGLQKQTRGTRRIRISKRFKQRIYWRDNGCCVYCDKSVKFEDATLDHVMPLVRRGRHRSKDNMVLACRPCNKAKGPLVMDDLGDLAPEQLYMKFQRTVEKAQQRTGCYRDWVRAHY